MIRVTKDGAVEVDDLPPKTPEEIEVELEIERENKVMHVARAVQSLIASQLDPAGLFLVRDLRLVGNQKGIETEAWVEAVYAEAESRKALIYADMWPDDTDPCDFSSFGTKPYTVAQLMMDLATINAIPT